MFPCRGNRQYFKLGVLRDFCVIKLSHVRKEVVNSCSLLLNVQTYVSCTFNINGIVVSLWNRPCKGNVLLYGFLIKVAINKNKKVIARALSQTHLNFYHCDIIRKINFIDKTICLTTVFFPLEWKQKVVWSFSFIKSSL